MSTFSDSFFTRFLSLFMAVLALSACATKTPPATALNGAEAEYIRYVWLVEKNSTLENLSDKWTRSAQQMFYGTQDNTGELVTLDNFRAALEYPSLFAVPPTEPVSVSNGQYESCLLAVGEASDGGLLALHIRFTKEEDRWLHDEVYAQYLDNSDSRPNKPDCQFPGSPS